MTHKKAMVDVAINAYGKPYQTAVTLLSLLKHSGQWIDKIYFVEEKNQPEPPRFQFMLSELEHEVIYFKPNFWFWINNVYGFMQLYKPYRHSIRYQYAWEKTDKDYLLVLHNDVHFTGDLVGEYLNKINGHTAVGKIGQCWNCSAHKANLCDGDRYSEYKPDYKSLKKLLADYPGARHERYNAMLEKDKPWPLPECRVNEYVAMINMVKARPATVPEGKAPAFGSSNRLDTAVDWFFQMSNEGHTFANFDYDPFAIHSWVSLKNAGHDALFNNDLYQYEESVARQFLKEEYGMEF